MGSKRLCQTLCILADNFLLTLWGGWWHLILLLRTLKLSKHQFPDQNCPSNWVAKNIDERYMLIKMYVLTGRNNLKILLSYCTLLLIWHSWWRHLECDWRMCECMGSCLVVWLFETLWTVAHLCPWDFPGKNTGAGCGFLLQGFFSTQGSNPSPLCLIGDWHC